MRWIGYVATILWWSGIARSLSTLNRGYKISPKPCRVPGQTGGEGTCMFVWECIKSEGTHVGVCVDTFMFGSCCVHNSTSNSISWTQEHQSGAQVASSGGVTSRPSLADALADTSTRLTLTSPGHTESAVTSNTAANHHFLSTSSYVGNSRPLKPVSAGSTRPLQKRPHAKPSTEQEDRLHTSNFWQSSQGSPQQPSGKRPVLQDSSEQKTRPTINNYRPGINEKPSDQNAPPPYQSHQGFKDKLDTGHNTLVIRLPGKEHVPMEEHHLPRPLRPSNQRPSESRPDDGKTEDTDLSVQETINRPSVNSVDDNDGMKNLRPSLNFIHTERPQWATKPATSSRPSTNFSKPYFSLKTSTHRPVVYGIESDARPNFLSKPENVEGPTKSTTTSRPSYYSSQTTSVAGSAGQTSHWQITTEPAFVTKQRPSSSSKPINNQESTRPSSSSSSSGQFWSENSWSPPRPSLKPHWTDNPSLVENGPENFPQRPNLKPTEPQENMEYHKPVGSAHYITTSHFEASTKPRPTKKTTMFSTTTPSTTTPSTTTTTLSTSTTTLSTTTVKRTTMTSTSTAGSVIGSMAKTVSTTERPSSTTTSSEPPKTGSVMTVAAAAESKNLQCGVPPLFPRPETRIVGGKDASFGRWPWQVSVRRTSFFGFSSTHRCGGAVLNENWIATAGHCVDDLLTSQIRIRVGEYDFSSVQERLPYVERGVAKKVVHPKYNFFTYEYDLALVRLESPLTFAPHISPICLPATDGLLIGENATVTGWGRLSEGGTLPSVLQEVSVPIVSNDRCKSMFLSAGRHEFIPEIFLCAGYETGGQDSCQGDSGGPLQVRGKDGRYFLAGIISWGIGCAEANLPGVCTRISKFVPWILKNVS
ncbi:serine proteinase stubble-like isoform X2 [Prorops nasuta]|uniref:serine proteinase stubble-like isoform X2 n=1 Tax=Prorops nasuta TaxID=863751 RepID=UPI0034CD6B59